MTDPWWLRSVVYQVYPRSFADSDGDGVGDLGGVLAHLDHLETLGVDVVWLSPIYPSPQADNGYDVSDYRDVDPLFGTLAQLDELLAALHARGMRLVLDLVVNHTSTEHPWFREAASSRDNPRRDWYTWRDAREDDAAPEPNNWRSFFGGSAWAWHEGTEQYYLHLFDRTQADLNWENPEVRAAVHDLVRFWVERGVDGFRMDVVNFLSKADGLPDAPAVAGQRFVDAQALFADGPRMHEHLAELRREGLGPGAAELLTVGEMPGVTPEQARRYTDPARGEVDMVFQFEHVGVDHVPHDPFGFAGRDLVALKRSLHRWQTELADTGWNSLYWDNHDQPRVVSRFGDDSPEHWRASATALATVLHGMRGTPYVYQGEELGMTSFPFTAAEQLDDVESRGYLAEHADEPAADVLARVARFTRDNARTPVQWDSGPGAGFTTGTPWLPVNPNHTWLSAAAQVGVEGSVFSHHQALVALRKELAVLVDGRFAALHEDDPQVWAYTRTSDTQALLVVASCGTAPREVAVPGWAGARLVLGNTAGTPATLAADVVELGPWDARMYLLG